MIKDFITIKPGKINDYLHHVDLKQLGARRLLSGYICEFDDSSVILDSGSSFEVKHVLRYAKKKKISLEKVKYLITSHHHFDHNGGMWKLYLEVKKHNPEVKILTSRQTKEYLNNFESHLERAKRSFGDMIGRMEPIEDKAFELITPSEPEPMKIIESFSLNDSKIDLAIIKTPGHTPDHQSSLFIRDGKINFIFFGEAVGTLYHSSELITLPVSAPIHYNYEDHMHTLKILKKLDIENAGFSHFGIVHGEENVKRVIAEHQSFMKQFRSDIIKFYQEKDETRYIVEKITPSLFNRSDLFNDDHLVLQNMILQSVYGVLMDLGYREN
ncbi:MAG: MBL fold metallo-hydrolase [Promethearchaeota archaeon]|nr:MAG: MBL fold metallo-hydrolase [Candidatus Lokiarchaeota archaeon]